MQRQLVYRIYYLAKLAMTKLQNILILKIWDQKNYGYTSSQKLESMSLKEEGR